MRKLLVLFGVIMAFQLSSCEKVNKESAPTQPAAPADVVQRFVVSQAPTLQRPLNAVMGDEIEILGYDLDPAEPVKGQRFSATFYFKVIKQPTKDWTFFGHLEPVAGEPFRTLLDHKPTGGRYPVNQWKPGEIIKDRHSVRLPVHFPSDQAQLFIGMFTEEPGKSDIENRLKPTDAAKVDEVFRLKAGVIKLAGGEAFKPKTYIVRKAAGAITIDGKLNEATWQKAESTDAFTDAFATPNSANPNTVAKLAWDNDYLYVAFVCADTDIRSSFKKNDDPIYREEAVELMIDADDNGQEYFELQVNPANLIFDKFFHGGPRQQGDMEWSAGMKTAVQITGTLNDQSDTDTGWTVEIAIPLKQVFPGGKGAPNVPPKAGDRWRANMFRVDHSGAEKKGSYLMWSPVQTLDFHTLRGWSYLEFSTDTQAPATPAAPPAAVPAAPKKP